MKKIKVKTPAKINFTLDVMKPNEQGFHNIKSLVASIDIYDYITIKKRTDWDITLVNKGIDPNCEMTKNNAYLAAKLFSDTFMTEGVDIIIEKNIPVGAGLGGSSADVAGVLNGMKRLFNLDVDVTPLASKLGSDTTYMLGGGYAILSGKGDKVEFKKIDKKLYLLVITEKQGASSKEVYQKFDTLKKQNKYACTETAYKALADNEIEEFFAVAKNDLFPASVSFVEEIDFNIKALKKAGAPLALMTGSGSAVFGVFTSIKERARAFKKLKLLFKDQIFMAETVCKMQ